MKLYSILLFLLSILLYSYAPEYPSRFFMGTCCFMAFFAICVHSLGYGTEKRLKRIYARHSVFFLIFYFIVNYQVSLDFVIGVIDINYPKIDYLWGNAPKVVSKASALSLVALSSFICGYNFYNPKQVISHNQYRFKYKRFFVYIGFAFLILYLGISGFGVELNKDENAGILIIINTIILSVLSMVVYELKLHESPLNSVIGNNKLLILLLLLYIIVSIATGKRGGLIKLGSLLLVAYLYLKSGHLNYRKLILISFILAFSISFIGIVRGGEIGSLSSAAKLVYNSQSICPFTNELASSVNTVHVALDKIPSHVNYNYGESFLVSCISALVPGLNRLLPNFQSSEDIITKLYFGGHIPDWGWGLGSSSVADPYVSFGILGVIFCFILFGRFLKYLEYGTFILAKGPYFLLLSFCCYSQLIALSRGIFAIIFLSLNYGLIILFFCAVKMRCLSNNKQV